MIRFDRSQRSVVAVCTDCGVRDVFTTQGAADNWAVDHALAHHAHATDRVLASIGRRTRRDTPRRTAG